ncbi:MAG: NHLP bacteriocin system secretion protein [Tatlockia sp.]|nr:NHLP bacteriocin system secretion protein [Tatlockia sp.]
MSKIKFRQAALEDVTSPERLTELTRVVTPSGWILLGAFLIILFILVLWSFLGSIPIRATGKGILLAQNGGMFDVIGPEGQARVINVRVKVGDRIYKNEVIAILEAPNIIEQVNKQQNYLQQLEVKYTTLLQVLQHEIFSLQKEANQIQEILQNSIKAENDNLLALEELLKRKKYLFKKGLIERQEWHVIDDLNTVKQHLEYTNKQRIQKKAALNNLKKELQQRLRDLNLKIIDASHMLAKLKAQHFLDTTVRSPINGIVVAIHIAIGDPIKGGKPIISIADEQRGLEAFIYVSTQDGQRIKVGEKCLVSPENIPREEFGSLMGKVSAISTLSNVPESIKTALHNLTLAKRRPKSGATVVVRISIMKDLKTFSGYKWSSGKGPDQFLAPGTSVKADITVQEQAPITLIIPTLRRWLQK